MFHAVMGWRAFACALVITTLAACGRAPEPVSFIAEGRPARLSDWHLLKVGGMRLVLNTGVQPYELNTPLFTDHAYKLRTVWMPGGVPAAYEETDTFDFPVGTIISKTFYYPKEDGALRQTKTTDSGADLHQGRTLDLSRFRLIETCLLVHRKEGWIALPYVWNAEQTEALLARTGDQAALTLKDDAGRQQSLTYVVPNENQCASCHVAQIKGKALQPIGLKARHLNRDFSYEDGTTENQLVHMVRTGYLSGVYAGKTGGALLSFNDVKRVEVLKGPQGTLFGRNAAGGAISIISNDPKDKFEASGLLRVGNHGLYHAEALINQPLGEGVAFRFSGVRQHKDGWQTNTFDGSKVGGDNGWGTGADLEAYWQIDKTWRLNAAAELMNQTYKRYSYAPDPSTSFDMAGEAVGTPRVTATVGIDARFALFGGQASSALNWAYSGKTRCNSESSYKATCGDFPAFSVGEPTSRFDLRLGWDSPNRKWGVALVTTNLLNKQYVGYISPLGAAVGSPTAWVTPPRSVALEVSAKI